MTHTAQLAAIELAYTLPADHDPTPQERATLAAFTGWGALARAFDPAPVGEWVSVADRLEQLLPPEAFRAAADQADTSFFTPQLVTDAVWRLLLAAGFDGGRVLEPGCGSGAFMSSTPAGLEVEWTGVEVDPTSARIARLLHPAAHIVEGRLERTPLRDNWFDAAVGNVPFSDVRVSDAEGRTGALHNYFAWRAADAVRPGGFVVLVTSRHAIDARGGILQAIRDWKDAAFIGAVRLPSGAFSQSGTSAVTDIIVLRKNDTQAVFPPSPDLGDWATEFTYYGRPNVRDARLMVADRAPGAPEHARVPVSNYWRLNPQHVAGRMIATGFDRAPLQVRSHNVAGDVFAAVDALASTLPPFTPRPQVPTLEDVALVDADGRKEGSYHLWQGQMHRVVDGHLEPVRASRELTALVGLRDLAVALLEAESDVSRPDESIEPLRAQTRDAYEAYVAQFGHLNRGTLVEGKVDPETGMPAMSWRRPAMGGFRRDPDSALVFALEVFDQATGEAGPAPILLGRVNRAPERVTHADTPAEALAITLGECGSIHLDRVAELLDLPDEEAAYRALGDLAYRVDGVVQPRTVALSGNVRAKLARARAAAAGGDQDAARLAAALEQVQPADLTAADVLITLGSPFVTCDDITAFLKEELGARWPVVRHTPQTATWEVECSSFDAAKSLEWSVPDMDAGVLVEHALNGRLPEVKDRVWGERDWKYVRNAEKSAAAAAKMEAIADRFTTWVWEDADRAARILAVYNERLNSHVARTFDGAGLTFPGLSAAVTPWPHQRAIVERAVSTERTLVAHPVGFGKTLSATLIARTLRQFGLARKPMIVVPNHLLEQISREAQQAYPTGRFLIATKDDLARDARRLFAARCATGDWDAVIITHSAFGQVPVRPDVEAEWIETEKMTLRAALADQPHNRSKGAKAIARAVRSLDARLTKLRDGKTDPDAIFFEQLGVDYLIVDEAHLFRRLDTGSNSRDNGMPSGASKRATDLLVKIDSLAARRPGAPIVALMTGTPWSNTLAETWVWQRFLQPDLLREIGLLQFDAWVSAFVRYESNIEVAPDGGFRMNRRPVGVVNAPELKMLLAQVADILDPESLQVQRPEAITRTEVVPATPAVRAFVRDLADRADAIRGSAPRQREGRGARSDDNMLLVCTDGRKVALDPVLVGIDEPSGKVVRAAELIAAAYHENKDRRYGDHPTPGGFQLVFLDLGTPRSDDTQTYGRLRRHLIDRGVPGRMIRFVHEATTDKAKAALFAACRDGEVAVLVASTEKAGMGTNVQTRLTHLWHLDAPWLPSSVTQREGRAIRPGNLNSQVHITRLVTEGSFDAFTWAALERKSRAFDALYATGATARELEDVSQATLSYGEVKALATGNPLLLEQSKARAQVRQLQTLRAMHLQSVNRARRNAAELTAKAGRARTRIDGLERAITLVTEDTDPNQSMWLLERNVQSVWVQSEDHNSIAFGARIPYRGITLNIRPRRGPDPALVTLDAGHRTFADVAVAPKTLRRGVKAAAGYVKDAVDRILDTLADEVARLEGVHAALLEQAAASQQAADGAVFDRDEALREAVERLARIDSLIAGEAVAAAA